MALFDHAGYRAGGAESGIRPSCHGAGSEERRLLGPSAGRGRDQLTMCGINGIFAYHYAANPVDRAELIRTRDHMAARGPDGMGEWVAEDGRIGLGHRRLAIIDLSETGAQPMVSADGRLIVTCNGEIYNYRQLRDRLERKGRVFRSRSDTEVLLHLYAEKGAGMVHDLRGMFAFALWDAERRTLLLARDPLGIKPLYYADDGWTFRFASQVKALRAGGAIGPGLEPAGQVGFCLFGSVPEPFTVYREIRSLPAGTTLLVDRLGGGEPRRYHSVAQVYREGEAEAASRRGGDPAQTIEDVRAALLDSVRHHLVADVPVGAFLSAGIDSGALVGLMRDAGLEDVATVTLAFDEFRGGPEDEAPLAEEVARLYGTRHTARVVGQAEFETDLPRILEAMDQPSIDGINTWFVAKAARELGLKVAVSGLGGDELFAGYPSFRDIPRWVSLLAAPAYVPLLGRIVRICAQPIVGALGVHPKSAGMLELGGTYAGAYLLRRGLFMPWELGQVLGPDVVAEGLARLAPLRLIADTLRPEPRSPHGKVASLETVLYLRNQLLRDTDWAGMAHGLEVRTPLADAMLLRKVAGAAAAARWGRRDTPKACLALSPMKPLPHRVVARAKTGFATPIGRWLQSRSLPGPAASRHRVPQVPRTAHWARQWAERLAAV
jgi:asparagine synthase (glutamine-hydrolysing)